MAVTSTGYQLNKQPIAQSFYVDEPNGIYVTKVDLFFATKDASLPVQIQIRPMENGVPSSSEIIPGSQVVLASSQVTTDLIGPALDPTSFTFEEPVFLRGELDYAIVVTADSKDYQIYIEKYGLIEKYEYEDDTELMESLTKASVDEIFDTSSNQIKIICTSIR